MPRVIPIVAVCIVALVTPAASRAFDLRRVLGLGCGDACGTAGCGCDAGCGCESSCACEPTCGCGDGCGVNGRQFAGQTWNCCRECGPPICECTGPSGTCGTSCGGDCGCAQSCDPGCGCEPACGCGPSSRSCGTRNCTGCGLFFGSWCGRVVGCVDKLCGCTGCDGELYWSEWHNDPPRCCDPCDQCGNWVGPTYGGYRAPYDHPYSVGSITSPIAAHRRHDNRSQIANGVRPQTRGITRKPQDARDGSYHR